MGNKQTKLQDEALRKVQKYLASIDLLDADVGSVMLHRGPKVWTEAEAQVAFDYGLRLPPDAEKVIDKCVKLGNAAQEAEDLEAAAAHFRAGLDAVPKPQCVFTDTAVWFLVALGDVLFQLERYSEALSYLDRVFSEQFDEYEGQGQEWMHVLRGKVLFELGRTKEAADEFAESLRMDPQVMEDEEKKYKDCLKRYKK